MLIVLIAFLILMMVTLSKKSLRESVLSRSYLDWIVDISGLVTQGILVPGLQIVLGVFIYRKLIPGWQGQLHVNGITSFVLNFVFVDYLYYWNHRVLHLKRVWPIHALHHTAQKLDFLITSRNTIWTPVFIIYLWVNSFFIFILADSTWFLVSVGLTAALDLWRHSTFTPKAGSLLDKYFSYIFVTPNDHAWHHGTGTLGVNFGGNLNFWDRWHGTYYKIEKYPDQLGVEFPGTPIQKLIFPFGARQ